MTTATQHHNPDAVIDPDAAVRSDVVVGHPKRPFKRYFRETGWRHLVGIAMSIFAAFPLLACRTSVMPHSSNSLRRMARIAD